MFIENEYKLPCLLKTNINCQSVFHDLKNFVFNKSVLINIVACGTDGAPSMVGKGFLD